MPDNDLASLVTYGREERNLEYKSSFPWNRSNGKGPRARVIKTCLAMANLANGGTVVVGVPEDPPGVFTPLGMQTAHLTTFTQDSVQAHVNDYADPYVDVTVTTVVLDTGSQFIVIQVRPFDRVPVICRKDGLEGLRSGAVYTRARKKHETIEVPSQTEMREILERASQLGLAQFIEVYRAAGLLVFPEPEKPGAARFEEELQGL